MVQLAEVPGEPLMVFVVQLLIAKHQHVMGKEGPLDLLELLTGLGLVGFLIGTYMLVAATFRAWAAWDSQPQFAGTYVLMIHVWMTTTM